MSDRIQRAGPLILIADDDETERFLQRQVLEPEGFQIIEAKDGESALEAFNGHRPDLVILDVMMPGMSGFEVCRAIRTLPGGRSTPVLMATALDDVDSIDRAYRVGATDFIDKPINWPVLPHRVRYLLRAHETLRNLILSQQRLAEAQRIAGVGNFRWLPHSKLVECSAELCRMFGLAERVQSLPVRALLQRIPAADRKAVIRALRLGLDGEKIDLDHRVVTPDGLVRTLYLRAEVSAVEDETAYLQGSLQDITERKRNELELAAARDEARSADAAKTAFLAAMSHELRTPLNAIIGFSEMIAGQAFGPIGQGRYIDYARNTGKAGQQMLDFVVDVLTIAQLEAGRFHLDLERLDLIETVEATLAEFRESEAGSSRDVTLNVNGAPGLVYADRRAVQQMLLKLLSNAVKFSPSETPIRTTITVNRDGFARVVVADRGTGMTVETAATAVQPFRQVDGRLARKHGGTGLGLSIVHGLIECHGGRLTIDSAPQKGTSVSLDFPTVRAEATQRRIAAVAD
ncbi:MAG: response regulator [Alphaproteobacteria bacterium]|nr:response regulator [Alphaproteobacteria bacterium]